MKYEFLTVMMIVCSSAQENDADLAGGLPQRTTNPNLHLVNRSTTIGVPGNPQNCTNCSLDFLLTLTFENPAVCEKRVLREWKINLTNMDFYCVCYKVCVGMTLSGRDLELQKLGVIEMMGDYHDNFSVAVKAMISVYSIILIFGIIGNMLVLVTAGRFLRQISVTNVFICSLSVADLLVLGVNIPIKIWQLWVGYWYLGKVACHLTHYLLYVSFLASILTLTAMSIERYMAICRPLRAQYMSTPGRARRIVALIWLVSLVLGLPTLFVTNYYENTWVCNLVVSQEAGPRIYVVYMAVVLFLVPSAVMGCAYCRMSITLWQSLKTSNSLINRRQPKEHASSGRLDHRMRIQVIRMLFSVWLVFVVCWAPSMAAIVCEAFGFDLLNIPVAEHALMMRIFTCLAYSNSCLNPLLYAFFSAHFRKGFVSCITSCCGRKRRPQHIATRSTMSETTRMTGMHKMSALHLSSAVNKSPSPSFTRIDV